MSDESEPTTLYVGSLDHSVSNELLCALFSQIGVVKGCKVLREPGYDPYAFVDFENHQSASTALGAMNGRSFLGKEMKVNWASTPANQPRVDTSNHYHVFVGDLSPEVDTQSLRDAFAPFGEISNCRIVRDPQTLKSRGYAFVSFVKRVEAENAILSMNGQWLGSRCIRTNWSTRKPPPPKDPKVKSLRTPTFDEVFNQTSPTNSTVYIGNCNDISDELIQEVFSQFGQIQSVRVFKDKGYAFIKFATKEAATHAIGSINNTEINGKPVKCFWGKESGDVKAQQQNAPLNSGNIQNPWPAGVYGNVGYNMNYFQGYCGGSVGGLPPGFQQNYTTCYNQYPQFQQNYPMEMNVPNWCPPIQPSLPHSSGDIMMAQFSTQ